MEIKLFDSHSHYYDSRFSSEHDGGAENLLPSVFASGVGWIINVGTNNENSLSCIEQAQKYSGMYAAVGIHPSDCQQYDNVSFEISRLQETLNLHKEKKIVALGEIGFDYHYDDTDKAKQRDFFCRQMELAEKNSLPVIIHDRDAHGDCMDVVRAYPNVRGVFHSYSGSAEMASELVDRGWYISFSGVVTFKNAARVQSVAASVPLERILVETDCPYLAPHPHRGELNNSGLMHYTVEKLAELHFISFEKMAEISAKNASELFGISL